MARRPFDRGLPANPSTYYRGATLALIVSTRSSAEDAERLGRRRKCYADETEMIKLKRAYDPISPADGARLLVERLWPRDLSKDKLKLEGWVREVAPTTELRKWCDHDPAKWRQFRTRDFREVDPRRQSWAVDRFTSEARHSNTRLQLARRGAPQRRHASRLPAVEDWPMPKT